MSAPHATVVGGAGLLRPGRYVINHRLPEPAALPARPLRGHKWFTTEGSKPTEEKATHDAKPVEAPDSGQLASRRAGTGGPLGSHADPRLYRRHCQHVAGPACPECVRC